MVVATIWQTENSEKEDLMANTRRRVRDDSADRIIESLAGTENAALEAVRKFVDTVNDAFPHLGEGGGTRQKIIDSAFKMTEELVGTSNQFAQRLVKVGGSAAKRAPARKAAARRLWTLDQTERIAEEKAEGTLLLRSLPSDSSGGKQPTV